MKRCVAVFGPSSAGKSELVNRLAMLEGNRPPAGDADDLRCVPFSFLGDDWMALDCPGSLEFAQTAQDAALAADTVIIVASPDPEQAVLAAPWIRIAERCETPHVIFINRMDECHDSVRDIVESLQAYSKQPITLRQVPIRDDERIVGSIDLVSERAWQYQPGEASKLVEIPEDILERQDSGREELLESLSEHDDWLIEEIILDRVPASEEVYKICARVLGENAVVPGFFGAASQSAGIRRLAKALRHESPKPEETRARLGGPSAAAFMTRTRKHLGKLVWIRNFGDPIKAGTALGSGAVGGLVEPFGERPSAVPELETGGIASAVKSDHLNVGNLYHGDGSTAHPDWYSPLPPVWKRAIRVKVEKDEAKLSEVLQKIGNEDPSLAVIHDQETGQIVLATQGNQHLRRLQRKLEDTFDIGTEAEQVIASYRETISVKADVHFRHKKQSGGAGQFADVRLSVTPAKRGEGFSFSDSIHGGSVPKNYIPAVRNGAEESMSRGPLGFPVVDVQVNLYDGQHHSVDSSDMAFRIAGRGGVAEALGKAQPVLLEPIYEVRFQAPSIFTGALNPMISSLRGQILGFDRDSSAEGWDEVKAMMPGEALENLINNLRTATQGIGRYEAEFSVYQELFGRMAEDIVAKRAESNARR